MDPRNPFNKIHNLFQRKRKLISHALPEIALQLCWTIKNTCKDIGSNKPTVSPTEQPTKSPTKSPTKPPTTMYA